MKDAFTTLGLASNFEVQNVHSEGSCFLSSEIANAFKLLGRPVGRKVLIYDGDGCLPHRHIGHIHFCSFLFMKKGLLHLAKWQSPLMLCATLLLSCITLTCYSCMLLLHVTLWHASVASLGSSSNHRILLIEFRFFQCSALCLSKSLKIN